MTLAGLMRPMTLVNRSYEGETDEYGADIPTDSQVEVVGALQQIRRDEPDDAGEFSDTRWLLILPPGTAVSTGDAVIYRGDTYELVGDPWNADDIGSEAVWHIEATCRRTGSAGDEVTE